MQRLSHMTLGQTLLHEPTGADLSMHRPAGDLMLKMNMSGSSGQRGGHDASMAPYTGLAMRNPAAESFYRVFRAPPQELAVNHTYFRKLFG